jgi:hypothetical protein
MQKLKTILFLLLLTGCASLNSTLAPTSTHQTSTQTLTPLPTATFTLTPIQLVNLDGVLFFDYNGSGLQENNEPPIANFKVCINQKDVCVTTDESGRYLFKNIAPNETNIRLSFVDPNAENPVLAFRYINLWKAEIIIDSYEMNDIQVPEQHLNDTLVIPIKNGVTTKAGNKDSIGLMQGFLTHPLPPEALANLHHINGFDHDPRKGYVVSYAGDTNRCLDSPSCNPIDPAKLNTDISLFGGIYDSHVGYDFMFPKANDKFFFMASIPGVIDIWVSNGIVVSIETSRLGFEFGPLITNGEIYKPLVNKGQKVYRGQIIGLTGESEYKAEHPEYSNTVSLRANYEMTMLLGPQNPPEPDDYKPNSYEKDPFGVTDPNVPMTFPKIEVFSSWTVFNLPQQPLVNWIQK